MQKQQYNLYINEILEVSCTAEYDITDNKFDVKITTKKEEK